MPLPQKMPHKKRQSLRSGEVGRGSGRVGLVESRQLVLGGAIRPSPGLRARPSRKREGVS